MIYTSLLENHTTLLTNMKDIGLYLWDRLCTDACSKRLCIENQQNPNYKPEFCGYFLHVTVRQILSSINIFFLKDGVRLKHCTNTASYQAYIRNIKILMLQFSIRQYIKTNFVCYSETKSTKFIFAFEQLTNPEIQNPQMVYSWESYCISCVTKIIVSIFLYLVSSLLWTFCSNSLL